MKRKSMQKVVRRAAKYRPTERRKILDGLSALVAVSKEKRG